VTDITLDFHLHAAQMRVFQSPKRFTVLTAGRRFGKTHMARVRAATKALDPKNVKRKPVFIIAPIATQAKLLYWQELLNMLHPVLDPKRAPQSNEGHIFLNNGVLIGVKGADRPDTLRGVGLYHAELDEYADMKSEVWESIIRPALADVKGTAGFIGTPKGRNHFWDLIQRHKDDPEWEMFHFTSLDNPFLEPSEIEAAKATMSSQVFRQEFMASFETGGSDSFKREWFAYSEGEPTDKDGKVVPGEWYVVVDLAGFAGVQGTGVGYRQRRLDQHAIAVVKVLDDERWWVRDLYLGRWGVHETVRRIVDACESCQTMQLGIEKGALYNVVAPEITAVAAQRHLSLRPEPLSHENKTKSDRIGWALQGRMEHGKILWRPGPHMREIEDQFMNFPSPLVHDDALDALSYIPQLAEGQVFSRFAQAVEEPYWVPTDIEVGL
jgi:hypothetical protein